MDIAKSIKELRESTGMSRKEFSEHTGIPVRTLEDWEAGRRTPPVEMVLYHSDEGDVSVDAYILNDSLWITQKAMAELFGVDKSGISRHLKKIFESGELDEKVVVAKIATTSPHGAIPGKTQDKESMFYNLDAIISVGYRVNSIKATKFRIWATTVLKEYMTKGFVLDDDRLKQGKTAFGKDYFRELLERVRSIRASERRIWQQITDIFAEWRNRRRIGKCVSRNDS